MRDFLKWLNRQFYWNNVIVKISPIIIILLFVTIILRNQEYFLNKKDILISEAYAKMDSYVAKKVEESIEESLLESSIIESSSIAAKESIMAIKASIIESIYTENENKRIAQKYQKYDTIKILDLNCVVKYGDSYRLSVGDIDEVDYVKDGKIYCISGNVYTPGDNIQKVSSKREKKDLIDMYYKDQLKFMEE